MENKCTSPHLCIGNRLQVSRRESNWSVMKAKTNMAEMNHDKIMTFSSGRKMINL